MQILKLAIACKDIASLQVFYMDLLGFEAAANGADALTLTCGASQLEFRQGAASLHHFAFNIPPDQIAAAADWVETHGLTLLPFEGERIVQFPNWDAESIYFHDPVGNIVEFIARRRLPSSGRAVFSIDQILSISEIGFATFTFQEQRQQLTAQLGIPVFGNSTQTFSALGDDDGLFILVDAAQKLWIPNMEPALPHWFAADIVQGDQSWHLQWDTVNLSAERSA